jgi:hypothetical protein
MTYMNYSVGFRRTRTHFLKGGGRDEGGNAIQNILERLKLFMLMHLQLPHYSPFPREKKVSSCHYHESCKTIPLSRSATGRGPGCGE